MSTAGKICLVLTLLLMLWAFLPIPGEWGGWTPKLLVIHNQWSEQLRNAKEDVRKKQESEIRARQELIKASSQLEALAIGWDQVIRVQPGQISNSGGQLQLTGIGSNQGIRNGQTSDNPLIQPVIHAFYTGAEGSTYVGEFLATQVGTDNATLQPVPRGVTHLAEQNNRTTWDMNVPWRLRTMIPSAQRARMDELHRRKVRTTNMIASADENTKLQNQLLQEAQAALDVRKAELLGDPQREPVANRPEFNEGLLKVTEDVEEQRDDLLLYVDTLRRRIKSQGEDRDAKVESIQSAAAALPGSSTQYNKPTAPKVAGDKISTGK